MRPARRPRAVIAISGPAERRHGAQVGGEGVLADRTRTTTGAHADRAGVRGRRRDAARCAGHDAHAGEWPTRGDSGARCSGCRERRPDQVYPGSSHYGAAFARATTRRPRRVMSQLSASPCGCRLMRWDEHGWDNYGACAADRPPRRASTPRATSSPSTTDLRCRRTSGTTRTPTQLIGDAAPASAGVSRSRSTRATDAVQPAELAGDCQDAADSTGNYLKTSKHAVRSHSPQKPGHRDHRGRAGHAAGMDPIAFRRQNVSKDATHNDRWPRPCWTALARRRTGSRRWRPRSSRTRPSSPAAASRPGPRRSRHRRHVRRQLIVDIEVNKKTGKIVVKHVYGAQDAGPGGQPDGLVENQIVGQSRCRSTSRALHEQVALQHHARDQPRLGQLPDPALQGRTEGDPDRRSSAPTCSRRGAGEYQSAYRPGGDRERVLRRDRRPDPAEPDDTGGRPSDAGVRGGGPLA